MKRCEEQCSNNGRCDDVDEGRQASLKNENRAKSAAETFERDEDARDARLSRIRLLVSIFDKGDATTIITDKYCIEDITLLTGRPNYGD